MFGLVWLGLAWLGLAWLGLTWLDFDLGSGKEIMKRRPAFVISRRAFNEHTKNGNRSSNHQSNQRRVEQSKRSNCPPTQITTIY